MRNGWWSIVVGGVVGALLWAGPVGMGSLLGGWMLGAVGVAQADTLCKPAGSLPQSKCTKDAQCCAGLVCEARQCQAGCHIGGSFYASGAINATQCQSCQPAVSTTAWTNLPADTACSDGTACTYNDVCSAAGVCGGTAITCTGDQCTDSACNGTAFCTETPKQDGTGCDDGNPCTTGDTCEAGICAGAPDHTLCLRADRTLGGTACHHRQTGRRSMVPDRVFP